MEADETRADANTALAPTLDATPPAPGMARPANVLPPDDALPPGEILGERYRVEKLVGRGGQGDVYRAEDLEVEGHVVALKLMHHAARSDQEKAEAMRELRMLAAVSHPAIVQFKDSGWYGARLWFVMPWLEGRSLEDAGRLPRAEARRIFETIAAGISALHAKGMRHQDVKPSNVFLARVDGFEEAMPILLDLGVAARGDDAPVAGSPDYFAPELAGSWPTGGEVIGPEADVFALALTLRNVLDPDTAPTLDPFSREDLDRRAREPLPPPSGRDLAFLRPAFERWLAVDPARRPSAAQLMRELAILTAPEDRRRERIRLLKRIAPYAVLLTIALGLTGWWAQGEMLRREKLALVAEEEAARAAAEERAARDRAQRAEGAAEDARRAEEDARRAEEEALARAAESAAHADARSQEAQEALARVRAAQQALGRAAGDRARLEEAIDGLTTALQAEAQARASERSAHQAEREEWERAQRAREEAAERQRRQLTDERDRALVAIAESEVRNRDLETRLAAVEARASAAEARISQAEAQAREAEQRAAAAETRAREAERRAAAAEQRGGTGGGSSGGTSGGTGGEATETAGGGGAGAGSAPAPAEGTTATEVRRDPRVRAPRGRTTTRTTAETTE